MEKTYQAITADILNLDKRTIEYLFGVADRAIYARGGRFNGELAVKYAFYNAGELCEVMYIPGDTVLCVKCHGNRRHETLNWLKLYLANGMKSGGWGTDIVEDKEDYFYAKFYKEEEK